jgi:DNA-binding transcriptional MerR regulator
MKIKTYETIDKKYWTITELAKELNIAPYVIRFWETQIPELKPKQMYRTGHKKGWRKYNTKERLLMTKFKSLVKDELYTLKGAQKQLKA